MGSIKTEVAAWHLSKFHKERDLLLPFLTNFDVTWATRYEHKNTVFSAYFLAPEKTIVDQFGIDSEILLVMSDFSDLQPRTMQAIDAFMKASPALGRIDPSTIFLVSPDQKLREWIASYVSLNPQFRVTVCLSHQEILEAKGDTWFIRSALSDQLFSRDLFNDQLPLRNDAFFFGRDKIAAELAASIKLSQNRGLFGLRKTGKTSLLFKVRRLAARDGAKTLYYDCKDPSIRNLRWSEFLDIIISDLYDIFGKRQKSSGAHVSKRFKSAVKELCQETHLCIILDEIEYVSPVAVLDPHWHQDFVPFWQTMWTTQSEHRQLSFIMAGVNPSVTEVPVVDGVQNPVFGIISPKYLTGLDEGDVRQMLGKFGKRMGLKFEHDASLYMFRRYGGHPMLTRMAGSYVNNAVAAKNLRRPAQITVEMLRSDESDREHEVMIYCPHVVSELQKFYPDEYEMLEWLATGNQADFYEFAGDGGQVKHLKDYGLLNSEPAQMPKIEIPVLERYILTERRRKDNKKDDVYVVPPDRRKQWLGNRVGRITTDVRRLERLGSSKGKPALYGENGYPEAERFFAAPVVDNEQSFENFINVCNRCFVEPIERMGKSLSKRNYFWDEVEEGYPALWAALLRIKLYRHEAMHLELTDQLRGRLEAVIKEDFAGKSPSKVADGSFLKQQKVLDGLFLSTMIETDRLL